MKIQIIRSIRKSIAIRITSKGEIVVRCPLHLSNIEIEKFIESKKDWVNKNISEIQEKISKNQKYYNYEKVLFMGEEQPFNQSIQKTKKWLKEQASIIIYENLSMLSKKTGLKFNGFRIISARKKWGSCDSSKVIKINYKLIMLPKDCINYVLIHELCHLKQMNHSTKFWNLVSKHCKNYKIIKQTLNDYSFVLELF